jgi:hypothetical protein
MEGTTMTARTLFKNGWGIGAFLLAFTLGADAGMIPRTQVRDKTTVRNPDPDVKVTSTSRGTYVRTVHDNDQWESVSVGSFDKTTETDWKGDWTDTGWETEAGLKREQKLRTESKIGNSLARSIGKMSLEEKEKIWEGEVGPQYKKTVKGDLGQVSIKAKVGAEGSVLQGENGYEAKGQIGIEAEVKGSTKKVEVGNKDFGASLKGSGKLEASAIAKGRLGAYVDDVGITFGAEGSTGVYVKGELKLNMEAHVFGVSTNVNLVASGYAGALAEGKAMVTLGWNGKISFVASLGASLGFGGGVAVEFEMDAEELMRKLNFADINELLAWLKDFQENPMPILTKLGIKALRKLHESGFAAVRKLGSDAVKTLEHQILKPIQTAGGKVKDGLGKGLAFLGRVIRAPTGETGTDKVNKCLLQAIGDMEGLEHGQAGQSTLEFPLCMMEGMGGYDLESYDGADPYAWYPFTWPNPYRWPSL